MRGDLLPVRLVALDGLVNSLLGTRRLRELCRPKLSTLPERASSVGTSANMAEIGRLLGSLLADGRSNKNLNEAW
jgi:hypothetical protein